MNKINQDAVDISGFISDFLTNYAPHHLTGSQNTLRSYETALILYIGYLENHLQLKQTQLCYAAFSKHNLEGWLQWLSEERNCSPETCNNRLSSIRTFLKYMADQTPKALTYMVQANTINLRKCSHKKVNGLTKEAVKALLTEPDTSTKNGLRNETFMVLMYATAARIDELLSLQLQQVHLQEKNPYILIIGKGNKIRSLYLLPRVVSYLNKYIECFHGKQNKPTSYLFYSRNVGPQGKMTQAAIAKMLKKYAASAHEKCTDVPITLHAHQFRHARASHWLEEGINIVQISHLLGHAQLQTTMVYLDISMEMQAKALEAVKSEEELSETPKWNPDTESLAHLCGLRSLSK